MTKRFGSTSWQPARRRPSLVINRCRSARDAVGRRIPIEFTQSTWFFAARMRMMCFLLVGSPCQSWEMQMMDMPSIICESLDSLCLGNDRARVLAVKKDPLPNFEVHEEAEPIAMLLNPH